MHAVTQPTVWIHGSNGLRIREYSPEQRIECLSKRHRITRGLLMTYFNVLSCGFTVYSFTRRYSPLR